MSYRFIYRQNKKLPKLSWLATIDKRTNDVIVDCGQSVECLDTFFVAGAWDGAFTDGGFNTSEVFYGSGCKIENNDLIFCTPSHSLMRLVYFEDKESIVLSNSVPFLLSQTGLRLSKKINQYERIFCSVLDGPAKMTKDIPAADGKHFSQVIVGLIRISASKELRVESRKKQLPFTDYLDYKARLSDSMQRLLQNVNDNARVNNHFGVVSTISSGYDSSACSAIAKEIGCDTVVSLSGGRYDNDNGISIARQLGYTKVVSRDMDSYRQKAGAIDAEVLADGELGTALQFTVFDDVFEDNLVFFGLRGSYWSITASMTSEFEMIGYFNCEADTSFTENSLQHGYLLVPLPTFGASVCESIFSITNSGEMKPWSIGGSYDKPIPRRILESKGVERESFGMVKYGGGGSFSRDNKTRLKNRMSLEGYRSFNQFLKEKKGLRWSPKRVGQLIKYFLINLPVYCNYFFSKLHINLYFKQKPIRYANPGAAANLIFWGTDVMCTRYRNVMNQ